MESELQCFGRGRERSNFFSKLGAGWREEKAIEKRRHHSLEGAAKAQRMSRDT